MLGLERGAVRLSDHDTAWEHEAKKTIAKLREIFGDIACDIQHVGSTSIASIKAKPIIDIAVAVNDLGEALLLESELRAAGFYYRPNVEIKDQLLFASGSYYDGSGDLQTHFIHVVKSGSTDWNNYINFRDYLNERPDVAKEYEFIKQQLAQPSYGKCSRGKYTDGKKEFIAKTLRKALAYSYLGKVIDIIVDRPLGSTHPKYPNIVYPVNCGYINGAVGCDGEELDVYLLGVEITVKCYTGMVVAIIHRRNDAEDKLVAAPIDAHLTREQILCAVQFQEQYFDSCVEMLGI